MSKKTAAVIGVGVIGLSTAILALERGYKVTIYSDKPPMETTSLKAAALFDEPYAVARNDLMQAMLEIAWEYYEQLLSQYGDALGVRKHTHWEAMNLLKDDEDPSYLDMMEAVTQVERLERPHVPGGYAFGWRYRTFLMDTPIFLRWLLQRFTGAGGTFVLLDKKFSDLGQLVELATDVIFNCKYIWLPIM
jgi:D-amino-acid oxidase